MAQYAMSIHFPANRTTAIAAVLVALALYSAESGADKLQGLMFSPATVDSVF
jgi:hypothetical protein